MLDDAAFYEQGDPDFDPFIDVTREKSFRLRKMALLKDELQAAGRSVTYTEFHHLLAEKLTTHLSPTFSPTVARGSIGLSGFVSQLVKQEPVDDYEQVVGEVTAEEMEEEEGGEEEEEEEEPGEVVIEEEEGSHLWEGGSSAKRSWAADDEESRLSAFSGLADVSQISRGGSMPRDTRGGSVPGDQTIEAKFFRDDSSTRGSPPSVRGSPPRVSFQGLGVEEEEAEVQVASSAPGQAAPAGLAERQVNSQTDCYKNVESIGFGCRLDKC